MTVASHDDAVEDLYNVFLSNIEDGYWDEVVKEHSYFASYDVPWDEGTEGREVGEFDILAWNEEDGVYTYVEVKTNGADLTYAEDQLERSDEFFPELEQISQTYLER